MALSTAKHGSPPSKALLTSTTFNVHTRPLVHALVADVPRGLDHPSITFGQMCGRSDDRRKDIRALRPARTSTHGITTTPLPLSDPSSGLVRPQENTERASSTRYGNTLCNRVTNPPYLAQPVIHPQPSPAPTHDLALLTSSGSVPPGRAPFDSAAVISPRSLDAGKSPPKTSSTHHRQVPLSSQHVP